MGSFVALAIVSLLLHGLVVRWGVRAFPRLRAHLRWLIPAVMPLALFPPVVRLLAHRSSSPQQPWGFLAATELAIVAFAALPLPAIELASAVIARCLRWRTRPPGALPTDAPEKGPPPITLGRREVLERTGGLVAIAGTESVLGWGMVRGRYAFQIEEVPVKIPGLPRSLDGYTIAQVSDIHVGLLVGEDELEFGLSHLTRVGADLVALTGDLIDTDARFTPMLANALSRIRARDGVFAIPGNHDYYAGASTVMTGLRRAGVDVLLNEGRQVRATDGGGFALLGVDDLWGRSRGGPGPNLETALRGVPREAPRILLAHQPTYFGRVAGQVALQLSGHTHGGQINPGFRPAGLFMPFIAGRYERNGSTLWVNRGFGVVGPPARVGAPPEITKIVLVAA